MNICVITSYNTLTIFPYIVYVDKLYLVSILYYHPQYNDVVEWLDSGQLFTITCIHMNDKDLLLC